MINNTPTTLLTGSTGFLGHYVLRDLLARGRRVVAIVRPPIADSSERLHGMLNELGLPVDELLHEGRLVLAEGSLPDLLPDPHWGTTHEIVSCAASLQLQPNGNEEPHRTNVEGVRALIDWADRHSVRSIHAVSTAYVCGEFRGRIGEVFHPEPPGFQTEYERTKWVAEQLFVAWSQQPGRTLTVYRPSFLIGDSTSGFTTQFGGFYQFVRMLSILKDHFSANGNSNGNGNGNGTHVPLRLPCRAEDPIQNLVPVDFASRVIAEVVADPALHGRIYHLTDPAPPAWSRVKEGMEEYFHIHGGHFVDPAAFGGHDEHSPADVLMWEKYDLMMPRVTHHIHFDNTNTRAVMREKGLAFPELDRGRLFTILRFAESRRWGSRANGRLVKSH